MTRVCIFGAGAIGGSIAARLALRSECEVSVVARGPHLAAIREHGLTLRQDGETLNVKLTATDNPAELGRQDFVILGLKATSLAVAAEQMQPLLGRDTAILFGQNGLPWWYFYKHGGRFDGRRLESVDPGGVIWRTLGPERAIGCVVWQAAEMEAPGVVVHNYGDRMPIGEPSGEKSARSATLSALLSGAGFKSPVRANLRDEIWLKLWGNLSFNPVSVLTHGTLEDLANDRGTRRVVAAMMHESRAVAETLGITFAVDIEERINMAARVGAHRTSMLQDVEAGRPIELDALLGSVIELADMTAIAAPALQLVYDLVKFRSRTA